MPIQLFTDSCCDLPLDFVRTHGDILEVLTIPVLVGAHSQLDDLGATYAHADFYKALRAGTRASTSQITAFRFEAAFREALERGRTVLYLGFSSGISGTFQSAEMAVQALLREMPDAPLRVVDTRAASIGLGVIVVEAIKRLRAGASADAVAQWVEAEKFKSHHWFGVDDLAYLKNGGRIPASVAVVGSALHVKPALSLNHEGTLHLCGTARGRKKSIAYLADKVLTHYDVTAGSAILIGHGDAPKDAQALEAQVRAHFPDAEIICSELSMTIASHVGPGMLAVAFMGDDRCAR